MWDSSSHTLYLPQTFLVRVVGFLLPRVGLIPVNTSYISSIPEEVRLQSRVYDSLNPKQPVSRGKDWAVMLQIEYSLTNSHHSLSISNFIIFCKVSVSRDLLRAIIQFWNTHCDSRDRNFAKYNEVWCNQKCTVWITCKVATTWVQDLWAGGHVHSHSTHCTANLSFVTCSTLFTLPVSGLETFLGAMKHLAIINLSSHEYVCLSKWMWDDLATTVEATWLAWPKVSVRHFVAHGLGVQWVHRAEFQENWEVLQPLWSTRAFLLPE